MEEVILKNNYQLSEMVLRLKFLPDQQREFFQKVTREAGLSSDSLAKIVGVSGRTYRDWQKGRFTIPLRSANILCQQFAVRLPEEEEVMVGRWKRAKEKAGQIGGRACFNRYGSLGTLEGRRKGGKNALRVARQKGLIPWSKKYALPKRYSALLAEFIGIMLGDGGLSLGQVAITLNGEADRFYLPFLLFLTKKLFEADFHWIKRKNTKAVIIYNNGVNLVNFLVSIGLKVGNKVKNQVGVSDWIKKRKQYRIACLRGLMDTDGGIFLHRYKVAGNNYLYTKLCFTNRSLPLLSFVYKTLRELGFEAKIILKVENKKVWLYNSNEVDCYLKIVGTHNPRLLKYQHCKKGRVVPNGKATPC